MDQTYNAVCKPGFPLRGLGKGFDREETFAVFDRGDHFAILVADVAKAIGVFNGRHRLHAPFGGFGRALQRFDPFLGRIG